ncbi:hypothetical protein HanXRQr2_Chr12g0525611 [Helianthus annuus]|uniref:Uncharacterized protein n=1 Tax=Helianthus annuus TaxID=4232 RepID=A0A9K3HDM3_HELAN|nr:hypothetical protein HanXRQr2_Chr12g0525611 [Helianthus annuus]
MGGVTTRSPHGPTCGRMGGVTTRSPHGPTCGRMGGVKTKSPHGPTLGRMGGVCYAQIGLSLVSLDRTTRTNVLKVSPTQIT